LDYEPNDPALNQGRSRAGGDWGGMLAEIAYIKCQTGKDKRITANHRGQRNRETPLKEFVDPYHYACISAGLSKADRTFEDPYRRPH
jgi:hypothetical protein